MDAGALLALLVSIEKRTSQFPHVTGNIDILLPDKENYDLWMEQMNKVLELKDMTCFVDGSLGDPDTKGESQDKNVRLSSKKWKKLDKLVMKWIRDSLDDTLKEVVKESKTSKAIWDMLRTYFDTQVQLDLLEAAGNRLEKTFMLDHKEKYNFWMKKKEETLNSANMKGFVDGSLKDPDPKGESNEENVKIYSVKWEKLDTQVMEWIRDSLDDTLKEVVKDSKTSKDIWYMLRTYFDTDRISSMNVREHVSIELDKKDHYHEWVLQMKNFLQANGMLGYVNGDLKDPGPKWEWKEEHVWTYSEKQAWSKRADEQVMKSIMASLNDILNNMVKEMKTAKELWDTLETFFSTVTEMEIKETNTGEASSSNSGTSNVGTIREELGPLDRNSLPKLKYETTYIEWKEQTESFLVEKKMAGFIDGTFRNPSKISRSIRLKDKAIVKQYSERWTLLDQRVMTVIKSSLSVILHDIVKDLKSSKEFWHALEILFTTGYPSNTPVIEAGFLSIKLSGKKNYLQWAPQIKGLLEVHGLQNLIDPLSRPPPPTFGNHARWNEYNQLLKGWILSSLEQNVIDKTLTGIPTATELWGEIKNRYDCPLVESTDPEGEYNRRNCTDLYTAIMNGDLEATKNELNTHGYDVELNDEGLTPLHFVISTRKKNDHQFFKQVLTHVLSKINGSTTHPPNNNDGSTSNSTNQRPILVDLVNRNGKNTLHRAALVGNLNAAKTLVDTDPYLLFKEDNDECLPIHVAISTPHKDTFRYLLIASKKHLNILANEEFTKRFGLIDPFKGNHGVRLLNAAIEAGYMEVAYQLIKMTPDIAREKDGNRTPLHRTVENYDKYYNSLPIIWRIFDHVKRWICAWVNGFRLYLKRRVSALAVPDRNSIPENEVAYNKTLLVLRSICNQVRRLQDILEKRKHYLSAACLAACEDQHEALKEITKHFPAAVWIWKDGYNLMQLAVKNRSQKVFKFLAYETKVDTYFFKLSKIDGNNLLHLAGELTPIEKLEKDSGAFLQMRKEFKWFKKVEKFALPGSDNEKNNMGETPMMVFRKEHGDLKKRGEEWMKTVANSYIIVAIFIITVTFAALITVPGGSQQGSDGSQVGSPVASPGVNQNSAGLPVYIDNQHFTVFAIFNGISFCFATISLVLFLSILTSRYTEEDFINTLPWKLACGLFALIVSLVGMMVAFGETFYLMFGHKDIIFLWASIAFLCVSVLIFIWFQLELVLKIFF